MTAQFSYHVPADQADLQAFGLILSQCFNAPISEEPKYLNRLGIENVRILKDQSQIIGGLGILYLGQWYGGARVRMAGVAAVGVKPEYRGKGAAIALMHHTLKDLHEQEIAISVLYPATQMLYRKVGYEQAGLLCRWEIPTHRIQMQTQQSLAIEAIPLDAQALIDLYQKQTPFLNGYLDRSSIIWGTKLEPQKGLPLYAYRFGSASQPEGYVVFQQEPHGDHYEILVRDWVLLTPAAIRQFWTFLAGHRSQIKKITWNSAPIDAISLMLPEQTAKIQQLSRWLMRIVHLQQALEQRGYPKAIHAELHLEIQDSLLPRNQGKFVLTVEDGKGTVTSGGRGELQLDISALAPLYTGLFSAQQLWQCDRLSGTPTAIATATQLFAGSPPWMPDFF